jgi:hypothetical protein
VRQRSVVLAAARRDEGRPGQAEKQGKSTPHVPMVLHPSPIDGIAGPFEQQWPMLRTRVCRPQGGPL